MTNFIDGLLNPVNSAMNGIVNLFRPEAEKQELFNLSKMQRPQQPYTPVQNNLSAKQQLLQINQNFYAPLLEKMSEATAAATLITEQKYIVRKSKEESDAISAQQIRDIRKQTAANMYFQTPVSVQQQTQLEQFRASQIPVDYNIKFA